MKVSTNTLVDRKARVKENIKFLNSFGNFTDFVTLPIKRRQPFHDVYWKEEFVEKTALIFIKRLNERVYRRAYVKGLKRLATVVSYEIGGLCGRPHFHLAIERPKGISKIFFLDALSRVVSSMEWLINEIDVKDYRNSGCIRYFCKGNFDKIILSACYRSK